MVGIWKLLGGDVQRVGKGPRPRPHVLYYYFIVFFKIFFHYVLNDNKYSIKLPKLTIMFRIEFKQKNTIEEYNREKGGDVRCTTVPISLG